MRLAPLTTLALSLVFGFALIGVAVFSAHNRPYLGLDLTTEAKTNAVVVAKSKGPAASIPVGTELISITGGGQKMNLEKLDLMTEPDGSAGTYDVYRAFLKRQGELAAIQSSPQVTFLSSSGQSYTITPLPHRPLISLPPDFWVQCAVGIVAWLVASAVFAFRPQEASARYLLLSGLSTLTFSPAASIYTTRELAVPSTLFRIASDANFFGGSMFTASFVALLLYYPRRLAPAWAGITVVALYVLWFVLQQVDVFESMTFARRFFVISGMASTFILAGIHWVRTKNDPVARAALQWFLMSWMFGTILFFTFILLPQMFGIDTSPVQGYSFLLFLLVYGGLAFGILRFRLFDLGDWWRKVLGWTAAVLLLVAFDLFFLVGLQLSTRVSLSLALLICGVIWLPMRSWIWGRLVERKAARHQNLFTRVLDTALTPPGTDDQSSRWRTLLKDVFDPLSAESVVEPVPAVAIRREGLVLEIPPIGESPALRLECAHGGRKLFTTRDAALATELVNMLHHALSSHSAYEQGVEQERGRIAREMHDNIGAQLLSALHSRESDRKDSTIREALTDLRGLINNLTSSQLSLEDTLAELRSETADRLELAGIACEWEVPANQAIPLSSGAVHALRSIIREAFSNIIRHSGATQVRLSIKPDHDVLVLEISDDGHGFDGQAGATSHGLINMKDRLAALGGTFEISSSPRGTNLVSRFPIHSNMP